MTQDDKKNNSDTGEANKEDDKGIAQAIIELREENTRREKILKEEQTLKANEMLSGTSGGHVEPKVPEKLSNIEYAKQLMKGEVNPLQEDDISIN